MKSRFLDNKQANKNEEERLEHGLFITLSDDIHRSILRYKKANIYNHLQ